MLNISPLTKSAGEAFDYYLEQDVIAFDFDKAPAFWWGKGIEALGLKGKPERAQFEALYQGKLPNGQQLGRVEKGEVHHRAGFELSFSAPKSFSLAVARTQDVRLLQAQEKALKSILTHIESDCASARVTQNGKTQFEKTGKFVAVIARHHTSRRNDPDIHSHVLVFNMTPCKDNQWRALASTGGAVNAESEGVYEKIAARVIHYGQLFRRELAYELKQLGLEIYKTRDGFWEIAGVPRPLIEQFSKRRMQDILPYLNQHELRGAKASQIANHKTRPDKELISPEQQIADWHKELEDSGYLEALDKSLLGLTHPEQKTESSIKASEAIDKSVETLSRIETVLTEERILNTAQEYAIGDVRLSELQKALTKKQKSGQLVPVSDDITERKWTTQEVIAAETSLLTALEENDYQCRPIAYPKAVERRLKYYPTVTNEQRKTLIRLSQSTARWQALVGASGTGKSYLLKPLGELAKRKGYRVVVLAATRAEAKQLEEKTGFKALTAAYYIGAMQGSLKQSPKRYFDKTLLLVENAQRLGTLSLSELVELSTKTNSRCIFTVNTHLNQGHLAGSPVMQWLSQGLPQATLKQVYQDHHHQAALNALEQSHIEQVIESINRHLVIERSEDKRLDKLTTEMAAALSNQKIQSSHEPCVALLPTKAKEALFVKELRQKLIKQRTLEEDKTSVEVLLPYFLNPIQKETANSYQRGQYLLFKRPIRLLDENNKKRILPKNTYTKVVDVNTQDNQLLLESQNNKRYFWKPNQQNSVQVFKTKTRELRVGEQLIWQQANSKVPTHRVMSVDAIKGDKLLLSHQGKSHAVDLKSLSNRHFDYGYCVNLTQLSVLDKPTVFCEMPSFSRLSHQKKLYQLLKTQGRLRLYLDHKDHFTQTLKRFTGDKLNALTVAECPHEPKELVAIEQRLADASERKQASMRAVDFAIEHLNEREAGFRMEELALKAGNYPWGCPEEDFIHRAIDRGIESQKLLVGKVELTTKASYQLEQDVLATATQKVTRAPLSRAASLSKHPALETLTPEQKRVVLSQFNSNKAFRCIQGPPGVGKTTLVAALNEIAKDYHIPILGLAPTHVAVAGLAETGIKARTLDSFLVEVEHSKTPVVQPNTLVILDEFSMVGTEKVQALQALAMKLRFNIAYLGDERQLTPINQGQPVASLQKAGIETQYLGDVKRQKTPYLQEAVYYNTLERYNESLDTLKPFIKEVKERGPQISLLVERYMNFQPKQREKVLLVAPLREDCAAMNRAVHEALVEEGTLGQQSIEVTIYVPQNLTRAELKHAGCYQKGHWVRFNQAIRRLGVERHDYAKVLEVHSDTNSMQLETKKGNRFIWHPHRNTGGQRMMPEVYQAKTIEISKGERLCWSRTERSKDRYSTAQTEVVGFDRKRNQLIVKDSKTSHILDLSDPRDGHINYAYCITTHSAQGKTCAVVLALFNNSVLINQRQWLVMISRGQYQALIVTNDAKKMKERILACRGDKLTALDILGQAPTRVDPREKQQQILKKPQSIRDREPVGYQTQENINAFAHEMDKMLTSHPQTNVKSQANKNVSTTQSTDYQRYDMEALKQQLLAPGTLETWLKTILPPHNEGLSSRQQRRYGNKGALSVRLQGDKRGLWHDFSTGEGGDLVSLTQRQLGLSDRKSALKEITRQLHLDKAVLLKPQITTITQKHQPQQQIPTEHTLKQQRRANKLWTQSSPIEGTLAERYLKEQRGLQRPFPKNVRFIPGVVSKINQATLPALIIRADKQAESALCSVQLTFLQKDTAKKATVQVPKQTLVSSPKKLSLDHISSLYSSRICAPCTRSSNLNQPFHRVNHPTFPVRFEFVQPPSLAIA